MTALRALWADILTPSTRDETPYMTAVIFIAHATLGAGLSGLGLVGPLGGAAGVAVLYFLLKERRDLARGGGFLDSLIDAGGVALGALYGPGWWPLAVLWLAFAVAVARARGLS